jgi:hypothetical protein
MVKPVKTTGRHQGRLATAVANVLMVAVETTVKLPSRALAVQMETHVRMGALPPETQGTADVRVRQATVETTVKLQTNVVQVQMVKPVKTKGRHQGRLATAVANALMVTLDRPAI